MAAGPTPIAKESLPLTEDFGGSYGYFVEESEEWITGEQGLSPTAGLNKVDQHTDIVSRSPKDTLRNIEAAEGEYYVVDPQSAVDVNMSKRIVAMDGRSIARVLQGLVEPTSGYKLARSSYHLQDYVLSTNKRLMRRIERLGQQYVVFSNRSTSDTGLYLTQIGEERYMYRANYQLYAGTVDNASIERLESKVADYYKPRDFTGERLFLDDQTTPFRSYLPHQVETRSGWTTTPISNSPHYIFAEYGYYNWTSHHIASNRYLIDDDGFDPANLGQAVFAASYASNLSYSFIFDQLGVALAAYTGGFHAYPTAEKSYRTFMILAPKDTAVSQAKIQITVTPVARREDTSVQNITYEVTSSEIREVYVKGIGMKCFIFNIDWYVVMTSVASQERMVSLIGATVKIEAKSLTGTGNYYTNTLLSAPQYLWSYTKLNNYAAPETTYDPSLVLRFNNGSRLDEEVLNEYVLKTPIFKKGYQKFSYQFYNGFKYNFGFIVSADSNLIWYHWNPSTNVLDREVITSSNSYGRVLAVKEWYDGSSYRLSFLVQTEQGNGTGAITCWIYNGTSWASASVDSAASITTPSVYADTVADASRDNSQFLLFVRYGASRRVIGISHDDTTLTVERNYDVSGYVASLHIDVQSIVQFANFEAADIIEDAWGNIWFLFASPRLDTPTSYYANLIICNAAGVHYQYWVDGLSRHVPVRSAPTPKATTFFYRNNGIDIYMGNGLSSASADLSAYVSGNYGNNWVSITYPSFPEYQAFRYANRNTAGFQNYSGMYWNVDVESDEDAIHTIYVWEKLSVYYQSIDNPRRHVTNFEEARVTMIDLTRTRVLSNSAFASLWTLDHRALVTRDNALAPGLSKGRSGASQLTELENRQSDLSGLDLKVGDLDQLIKNMYTELRSIAATAKILSQQINGGL